MSTGYRETNVTKSKCPTETKSTGLDKVQLREYNILLCRIDIYKCMGPTEIHSDEKTKCNYIFLTTVSVFREAVDNTEKMPCTSCNAVTTCTWNYCEGHYLILTFVSTPDR